MRHTDELSAALHAAEQALDALDVTALLIVTEIGREGLQIALSDGTDPLVVRSALRGAADTLDDGKLRPVLADVFAALKARGWSNDDGVWRHQEIGRPYGTVTEALMAQTAYEIGREARVDEATVE